MTNPLTGKVTLTAGATDYTLKFSAEALILVEDALDVSVLALPGLLRRPRLKHTRAMLWAALQEHHPTVSLKQAGDLVAEVGLIDVVGKLGEAISAAFPERKDAAAPQVLAAATPPDGTGDTSTQSGSN